ncbi:MAG: aminopeptidase P family protein [Proteobacteria bacterium]|nr:aminopeptidase P family protein [Pseudomonadota bacterium]
MTWRRAVGGIDDSVLTGLREAGARFEREELADLLAGIAAAPPAPPGHDPLAWTALVAPRAPAALRRRLAELVAGFGAGDDGLGRTGTDPDRLAALRAELSRRGLDGVLVPRGDEHQGETVPRRAERLAWLTGFTGSAGMAVVLAARAALFVDGRYTLQAAGEVDAALIEVVPLMETPPEAWLERHLAAGARIGFDPWLHTEDEAGRLRRSAAKAGAELVALDGNPVDAIWIGQPPPPIAPVVAHPAAYAGEGSAEKRRRVRAVLAEAGADALLLTRPDALAWLLNIRGADVPFTPLALGFAIARVGGPVTLFMDRRKFVPGLDEWLGPEVAVEAPAALGPALDALGAGRARVLADPATAPAWAFARLGAAGARLVEGPDPTLRMKARKNPVELAGMRAAHRRDGAAMARFLAWLAREAPKGEITEIAAARAIEAERAKDPLFRGPSFATIAGAGPNGAIVHYRVSERSNRRLDPGTPFLVDSGGQYLDATTDVTRTIAVGAPTDEMRARFTRVLKGHIALATLVFPEGTLGAQIDAVARQFLWQAGLDFEHGTGHGVGCYLGVHEGPQSISKLYRKAPIEEGMVVSDEPGSYKAGAYGIRIENLLAVRAIEGIPGAERSMLGFEVLTLVPVDLALIERELLAPAEVAWLNAYHARVRSEVGPLLDPETAAWLARATRPI